MSTTTIHMSLTRTGNGYHPTMDGWHPGAPQLHVTMTVDLPRLDDPKAIAEAVFVATNAPMEVIDSNPEARAVYDALQRITNIITIDGLRSLSVGDTVTIDLHADRKHTRTYACQPCGWEDVTTQMLDA